MRPLPILAALLIGVVLGHHCAQPPEMPELEAALAVHGATIDSLTLVVDRALAVAMAADSARQEAASHAAHEIDRWRNVAARARTDTVSVTDTVTVTVETILAAGDSLAAACEAALIRADSTAASLWTLVAAERVRADSLDAYRLELADRLRRVPAPPSRLRWYAAGAATVVAIVLIR